MVQFLSINFFPWISSIFVGFFKSSRFFVSPCMWAAIVVPIVTRPQPGQSGVQFQSGVRDFHLIQNVQTRSRIHTASYFMHRVGSNPGLKHLQCEVNHSLATTAKIKNKWSYNSAPPICIHSMNMDNCTSILICVRTSVIYTAATGSLCTSISSIGRSLHPYHVALHSYTRYQEISHQIYFCTYYYFWRPKMWVKKFPHKHICTYNMWLKK